MSGPPFLSQFGFTASNQIPQSQVADTRRIGFQQPSQRISPQLLLPSHVNLLLIILIQPAFSSQLSAVSF